MPRKKRNYLQINWLQAQHPKDQGGARHYWDARIGLTGRQQTFSNTPRL